LTMGAAALADSATGITVQTDADTVASAGAASGAIGVLNGVCGNSAIEAGEECDDGNAKNGDGCSFFCKKEDSVPAVEKMKQVFVGDSSIVGISIGASFGGLIFLSLFAVYIKRKYGHTMCCFKSTKVAPAPVFTTTPEKDAHKSEAPKSAALPRAAPLENSYTQSKKNVIQTVDFAQGIRPVTIPH
jgi:cysteine-rich repeat protein